MKVTDLPVRSAFARVVQSFSPGMDVTVEKEVARARVRQVFVEVCAGPDAGTVVPVEAETVTVGSAADNTLQLSDRTVSRYHVELTQVADGVSIRDLDSRNGTFIGAVRVISAVAEAGTEIAIGDSRLRIAEGKEGEIELLAGGEIAGLRGQSTATRRLMAKIQKLGASTAAVLLQGESGSGKEVVARALHDISPRSRGPFVTVDCARLSPTLIASELFGHERGAFTGADKMRRGAFELADGGTIFLDEVGELPDPLQAALLGALERRSFKRLGASQEITTDVRVVSATHRDLRHDVNSNRFRLDLFFRLAVVRLEIPPLRARPDDIPILVEHFMREFGDERELGRVVSDTALKRLGEHAWPGNVRELRNWVEATLALGESAELIELSLRSDDDVFASVLDLTWKEARSRIVTHLEAQYLKALMERHDGVVSKAAQSAKLDRGHLTDMLRRHGLR